MSARKCTITDVAKLAQTSTATVSHYLNGKMDRMSKATQERIAMVIAETGYFPNAQAQSLAQKSSNVIALLILDNTNAWAGQLISGAEGVAHQAGYQTVVCDTHFDHQTELSYVEKMLSLGVDGFIIQPTSHYRAIKERLERTGRPVVFYDFSLIDLNSTWVKTDLYGGVYSALSECANMGYEDFVMLTANAHGMRTRSERYQGALDALEERGMSLQTLEVSRDTSPQSIVGDYLRRQMHPARRTLVFCPHQWALRDTYLALCEERQLIPHRLGLLGLNCAEWADLTQPSISTIVEPVEKEGAMACSQLIELLKHPDAPPRQQVITCETHWHDSTSA